MKTKVSTKGQVVLPLAIRKRLDLRPGDPLDARVSGDHVILIPRKIRVRKSQIIDDPVTGLPVLSAGEDASPLTSEEVAEILNQFP